MRLEKGDHILEEAPIIGRPQLFMWVKEGGNEFKIHRDEREEEVELLLIWLEASKLVIELRRKREPVTELG